MTTKRVEHIESKLTQLQEIVAHMLQKQPSLHADAGASEITHDLRDERDASALDQHINPAHHEDFIRTIRKMEFSRAADAAARMYKAPADAVTRPMTPQAHCIHAGTLGPEIDKMLGTCPKGAPLGYILRKLEYETPLITSDDFVITYRHTDQHLGYVTTSSSGTLTYSRLNLDGAGTTSAQYASIAPQRLQDGDMVVASILRLTDGRAVNDKSGHFAAGIVPIINDDAEGSTHYGVFSTNPSEKIVGNSIGGAKRISASTVKTNVAIVRVAEGNTYWKKVDRDTTAGQYKVDSATPVMAIAGEGYVAADAVSLKAHLAVYALVGPRDADHSHPGRNNDVCMSAFQRFTFDSQIFID